jgi:hypothetical protein
MVERTRKKNTASPAKGKAENAVERCSMGAF